MNLLFSFFASIIFSVATPAEESPVKQGSKLQYAVTVNGNSFYMFIRIDSLSANNCNITWSFEDGRSGIFIMKKNAPDSASLDYWNPPIGGEELLLPAIQNVLFLSRSAFSNLQKNKSTLFEDHTSCAGSSRDENVFTVKDKSINAMFLKSGYGTRIWVLNDSTVPLILKIEGNPYGVEVELVGIE